MRHVDMHLMDGYCETVVLPRPEMTREATQRLHRDKDEANLDELMREGVDKEPDHKKASTKPKIEKAFAGEYNIKKEKAHQLLKLRFREVKMNGRDLLQYKGGSQYAVLSGPA